MTYSIRYNNHKPGDGSYTEYAADWDWGIPGKWSISIKEGVRWTPDGELDKKAYQAVLEHFGLQEFSELFPLEKIITMSWEELGKSRRQIEKEYGLPRKEIKSDTIGNHIRIP